MGNSHGRNGEQMMSKKVKLSLVLTLMAILWGFAFAFQSMGADKLGSFTFMAIRNAIAVVTMLFILIFRVDDDLTDNAYSVKLGLACGVVHCAASTFQQYAIGFTTAANSSFITSMYVIMVPALGILYGKKTNKKIWLCVILEIFGMYLLCIKDGFSINKGDLLTLITAFLFAVHIICLDLGGRKMDAMIVCFVQFLVSFVISTILMLAFETPVNVENVKGALIPLLYTGCISSAICVTIQASVQKELDPTLASVIMCLESVFGAIGGWIILHEILNTKEIVGCLIMFIALVLSQMVTQEK